MGIACLDMRTDKVLWSNRTLRVKHENGPGSSPILWNDRLIIHCDGIDLQYIVAIDKNTGEILWKTQRSGKLRDEPQLRKAYATSIIVEVEGRIKSSHRQLTGSSDMIRKLGRSCGRLVMVYWDSPMQVDRSRPMAWCISIRDI